MKIAYRVNPPNAPDLEFMDSKQPQIHSLKHQKLANILHLPDSVLLSMKGVYSEVLLERIRNAHYSILPSRWNAVFVFEGLDEAKKFQVSGWTEEGGMIYAYDVENLYSPPFFADMCLTNMLANLRAKWEEFKGASAVFIKPTLEESLEYICHAYWQGKTAMDLGLWDKDHIPEVLLDAYLKPLSFVPLNP